MLRDRELEMMWNGGSLAVVDHVNSTRTRHVSEMDDQDARIQIEYLMKNGQDFGLEVFDMLHKSQGIEHIVAPEMGFVLPGVYTVGGDSHTTTYGAFGAVAMGIGTSDIGHVLATQALYHQKLKNMRVRFEGALPDNVSAKDLVMAFVGKVGASGATGFAVEFSGSTIDNLSMEGRMTICNMAVEAGARVALMAPDAVTFDYLKGRVRAPSGAQWDEALACWKTLRSDPAAEYEKDVLINAADVSPLVSWGTSPEQIAAVDGHVPTQDDIDGMADRDTVLRALEYMGLKAGQSISDIKIDYAFIGSCTNSRIEDLRTVAKVVEGRHVADGVQAIIVPGSMAVREQAEAEGLAKIFKDSGFEWRLPGCSMCLAMNDDILPAGTRCASSTNRNFEGRQGRGGRTHLASPSVVAGAAIHGHFTDART